MSLEHTIVKPFFYTTVNYLFYIGIASSFPFYCKFLFLFLLVYKSRRKSVDSVPYLKS